MYNKRSENGGALIACIVIAMLFMAGVAWYAEWNLVQSKSRVHRMTARDALVYADEGVNDAVAKLKSPDLNQFLPINATTSYMLTMPHGRVDVVLSRKGSDPNLVELFTTAYYYLPRGSFQDPVSGKMAQRAALNAKYRVANVSQFLISVPTTLPVSYGTNAPTGSIYATRLQFLPCSGGPCNTPTQVKSAYFYESVTPSTAPAYVQFTDSPGHAQRLTYPMSFCRLDPTLRDYYSALATQPLPASFDGLIAEPAPAHVYFKDGDVEIAQNSPMIVQGVYVIYATGNINIHNNVLLADVNSWVGFLSEREIHLTPDAPNTLELNGYFISNGIFQGDPLPGGVTRTGVNLLINGGIVSMTQIDIATAWQGTRVYSYKTNSSPFFHLPNFSQALEYKIVGGKHQ